MDMDFRIMKKKEYLVTTIIWIALAAALLLFLLLRYETINPFLLAFLITIEAALLLAVYMTVTRNGGVYMRLEDDSLKVMYSLFRKKRFAYRDIRSLRVLRDEMTLFMKTGRDVRISLDPMDQETRKAFVKMFKEKLNYKNA